MRCEDGANFLQLFSGELPAVLKQHLAGTCDYDFEIFNNGIVVFL